MGLAARYDELIAVPRALRWPVELEPPPRFDPARAETWPRLVGRLEYVDGRSSASRRVLAVEVAGGR